MNWHLLSLTEVSEKLETSPSGITERTAEERQAQYGKNQIEDKKKKTVVQMLVRQFQDFMIIILIIAAIISGIMGDVTDTIVIVAIVIINAVIGVVQEYRAEKAM